MKLKWDLFIIVLRVLKYRRRIIFGYGGGEWGCHFSIGVGCLYPPGEEGCVKLSLTLTLSRIIDLFNSNVITALQCQFHIHTRARVVLSSLICILLKTNKYWQALPFLTGPSVGHRCLSSNRSLRSVTPRWPEAPETPLGSGRMSRRGRRVSRHYLVHTSSETMRVCLRPREISRLFSYTWELEKFGPKKERINLVASERTGFGATKWRCVSS